MGQPGAFPSNLRNQECAARSLPPLSLPPASRPDGEGEAVSLCPPPHPPAGCPRHTPREGADVGLKEVKSTSAAFLRSLVIQKANWGESTGKKREEGKPQETFCTIPRNRGAFRQATAIPLKPETGGALARPQVLGTRSWSCLRGVGCPAPTIPWEQSHVPNLRSRGPPGGWRWNSRAAPIPHGSLFSKLPQASQTSEPSVNCGEGKGALHLTSSGQQQPQGV